MSSSCLQQQPTPPNPPTFDGESRYSYKVQYDPELVKRIARFHRQVGPIYFGDAVYFLRKKGYTIPPPRSVYKPENLYNDQFWNYFKRERVRIDWPTFRKASQIMKRKFYVKPRSLRAARIDDVLSDIKLDTNAGLPTLKRKRDALYHDRRLALRILWGKEEPPPAVAFYRTQPGKVRLVWGYPLSMTLLEGTLMKPIVESLRGRKIPYPAWHTGVGLSGIVSRTGWSEIQFCLDWSKFDSTVPRKILNHVWEIISAWFDLTHNDTTMKLNAVKDYFLNAGIVMPGGFIFKGRARGIPSGSWFTQLIGSMVNYLIITYISLRLSQPVDFNWVLVFGDDAVVPIETFPNINGWASEAALLGMTIHPSKQVVTHSDPHFLGHRWSGSRWYRDIHDTLSSLATGERYPRYEDYLKYSVDKAKALLIDNPAAKDLILEYLNFRLRKRLPGTITFLRGTLLPATEVKTGIWQSMRHNWGTESDGFRKPYVVQMTVH